MKRGFVNRVSTLKDTPATVIACSQGKLEVMKRIESDEGRRDDRRKMSALSELRKEMFRVRAEHFQWDISNYV